MERAALEKENEVLRSDNDRLSREREEYRKLYQQMLEQCRKLELGILGQKAERLQGNDAQLTLSILNTLLSERDKPDDKAKSNSANDAAKDDIVVPEHKRKHPGRKPLPKDLPRIDVEVLPDEVKREGLDAYERIGQEVTETLERRRASLIVVRTIRPKFVRKDRDKNAETEVLCGELPDLPIVRGLAGPGMLASTLVQRWQDHLPLHRLESVYRREGIDLARSTIGSWHMTLADLCRPLYDAMFADAMTSPYLCTDATGVLVQAKKKCRHGHFWILLAPEKHALFAYSKRHDSAAVDAILKDYKGYLVADAHVVYDHLYTTGDVIECGCWSHLRRYFHKSLTSDPDRAHFALALFKGLFRIERQIKSFDPERKKQIRLEQSKPFVDQFFEWCEQNASDVLDETPISKAIGYAKNHKLAFRQFLEDGRLPMHNNSSEQQLRREAVGRKNWIFVGSDDGGITNAIFVTLLASCQMHGIEPWAYLRDLLCLLPTWPKSRVLELAPAYFKKTLEQPDTQQRLAANVFRQAILGELDNRHDLNN